MTESRPENRDKLVAELGIAMRTVERIVANEEDIRQTAANIADTSRKRKRTGKDKDVETALGSWFSAVRGKKTDFHRLPVASRG